MQKDIYLALSAIAWADGRLDPDEADAIVRAAADDGLSLEEMADVEAATQEPLDLGVIDRASLSEDDRLFVYGVACWIARMDGRVSDEEAEALAELGERLGIPAEPRAGVAEVAKHVAELPDGDRPLRYDLVSLRRILREKLQQPNS
jgi:uncharacterized membrane protein YebE (DUF533 family)